SLARIDFQYYGTLFIPSSWFSPLRPHIEASLEDALHTVLDGLRLDLREEADGLRSPSGSYRIVDLPKAAAATPVLPAADAVTEGAIPLSSSPELTLEGSLNSAQNPSLGLLASADVPQVPVASMPELARFRQFVQQALVMEQTARTFNRLVTSNSGDLKELGEVVKHCFNKDLPPRFYSGAELYQAALKKTNAPPFELAPFRAGASARAQQLARELYGALYGRNAFAAKLQQLSVRLHQAATQWPAPLDTASFAQLVQQQREVETQLSNPELEWAFRRDLDLGPEFNALLVEMAHSELFGVEAANLVQEEGREGLWQFQRRLAATSSPLTGPLLASGRDGRLLMQLSPDTLLLKSAVESFVGEGFVAGPEQARRISARVPDGMRLAWDQRLLQEATGVSQAYDRFRTRSLDMFPAELRSSIDSVARERAETRMIDLVAQAQKYAPVPPAASATSLEEQVRWDVGSFSGTVQPVIDNLDAFTRQGSSQPRRDLADAATSEAYRLLRSVDRLLEVDAPYRPRQGGFGWWSGNDAPSPAAWGGQDAAD